MAEKEKWMQEAFANSHGQFAARAKAAGMTTKAYARHVMAHKDRFTGHTIRQANLALQGMAARHKRR